MQTIGFIGLGTMGGEMAARYLDSGYTVYGEDVDRDHASRLFDKGLRWLGTPREVAETADVIMTSLPNEGVVEAIASGPDGLIAGLGYGKVWVDLSTISPTASRALAARVVADGHGAKMLDTPVSGSVPQIRTGTLTIMVGGDLDAYELVEPILSVIGAPEYIGSNGQGLMLKLAINISLAAQMVAFSEGLLLAERDGIDPHRAAEVMTKSAIGSPMLRLRVPLVLDKPDEAWFAISLMHKDIRLARQAAAELETLAPSASMADQILTAAEAIGYSDRDIAGVYDALAQMSADQAATADQATTADQAATADQATTAPQR